MNAPLKRVLELLTEKGCQPKSSGSNWHARCPAHEDQKPSLSVAAGDNGCVLVKCHAGCEAADVIAALGLAPRDLFTNGNADAPRQVAETYDYRDEKGAPLFQVVRTNPKGFYCRRPDGGGGWINDMKGVRRVIYRLPDLIAALRDAPEDGCVVHVPEGEKDVARLSSLGFPATTNPGGAGKWGPGYAEQLRAVGAEEVVIFPDNDHPGDAHARQVASACAKAGLRVKIARLPGLPPLRPSHGEDVSDWLDMGNGHDQLAEVIRQAPPFSASEHGTAPTGSDSLALVPLGTLLDEPDEVEDWLVDQLLPAGGLSLLAGKPKAGKSTEARSLAMCVARGTTYLGRTAKQGAVFYLALEEKKSQVRAHFERMGGKAEDSILTFVASMPEDGLAQLEAATRKQRPALIIVDTLIRATRLKDANDYAQVSLALEPYLNLARETGAHILLVHHMGKGERGGGDAILGSTALFATVDTALLLKRTDRYRTIQSIQRYGEDLPETVVTLDPETGFTSPAGTREEVDEAHSGAGLVEELQGRAEPVREEDLLGAIEGRKKVKQGALRRLVAGGRVRREGKGVKGDPYVYSIPSFLPPSYKWEGESSNLPGDVTTEDKGSNPTSHGTSPSDSTSRGSAPEIEFPADPPESSVGGNGDGGHVQPPGCHVCKQGRFWRSVDGCVTCGTCHPPAPEMVSEWLE